jgi:hypothetical protein
MTIGPTCTGNALKALTKVQYQRQAGCPLVLLEYSWRRSYVRLLTDKTGIFCYIEVFKLNSRGYPHDQRSFFVPHNRMGNKNSAG